MDNQKSIRGWYDVSLRRLTGMFGKTFLIIGIVLSTVAFLLFLPNMFFLSVFILAFGDADELVGGALTFLVTTVSLYMALYFLIRNRPKRQKTAWYLFSFAPICLMAIYASISMMILIENF